MDWNAILAAFWAVIVLAMAYSYEMYKKASKKDGEFFQLDKIWRTIIISVTLGVISAVITYTKGWTFEEIDQWGTNSGLWAFLVVLIDQIIAYYQSPRDTKAKEKLRKELEADLADAAKVGEKLLNGENAPKGPESLSNGPNPPASGSPGDVGNGPPGQP